MITDKYVFFWGHKNRDLININESCLSQWFPAEVPITPEQFPGFDIHIWGEGKPDRVETAEHFMMLKKAHACGDYSSFCKVFKTSEPDAVKRIGRAVIGYSDDIWAPVRLQAVVDGSIGKFGNNPKLKEFLLSTGDRILVEASPYDKVWGIGMGPYDPLILDPKNWKGENLLGQALMVARDHFRGEAE